MLHDLVQRALKKKCKSDWWSVTIPRSRLLPVNKPIHEGQNLEKLASNINLAVLVQLEW